MRAEINWIIPDIMGNTYNLQKGTSVSHKSPQFFDEKDGQRQWCLEIASRSVFNDNVILYVWGKQPLESSFATKVVAVVRDEKEGQPHQLVCEKTTRYSPEMFGPYGDLAHSFEIGSLEQFKKLSTVSVHCTVEYVTFNMKGSDSPGKQVESNIINVDREPMKLPVTPFTDNNDFILDSDKKVLKESDAPINQVASPIIDVGIGKEIRNNQEVSTILDVNQHSTGLIQQDLEQLLKNQSATDICFIIDSHKLRVHKLILSARSPVFSAIIKAAEENDNLKDVVEIKNISFITFKELIHFLYTDQVSLTESNADSLLATARKYSIPLLINKCEEFLYSTSLTVENCSEKLIDADINDKDFHLKKMVMDYIRSNPAEVMKTNGWTKLKKSHPEIAFEVMEDIVALGDVVEHTTQCIGRVSLTECAKYKKWRMLL